MPQSPENKEAAGQQEVKAAQILEVLRQQRHEESIDIVKRSFDDGDDDGEENHNLRDRNIKRPRRRSLLEGAANLYDRINDNQPKNPVALLLDDNIEDEYISKRQIIAEALAQSRDNLKDYKLSMSIESKKRLVTCLHLLKLANKQLADKVSSLQEIVNQEAHETEGKRPRSSKIESDETKEGEEEEDGDEEFFDARDSFEPRKSKQITLEVVGTIKKVYSLISKFTGNTLPEPARSQVRQTLLNLPTHWNMHVTGTGHDPKSDCSGNDIYNSVNRLQRPYSSSNGKILILAKESLDMMTNVMDVVDSSLGKMEEWVKQKQEVKEMVRLRFLRRLQAHKSRHEADDENAFINGGRASAAPGANSIVSKHTPLIVDTSQLETLVVDNSDIRTAAHIRTINEDCPKTNDRRDA